MTRTRWRGLGALVVVVGAAAGGWSVPADAQTGPSITLDRQEVGPGEPVLVTFQGFESQFVNVVLCGNLAYRGATDCNVTAGLSKETLAGGRPRVVQLIAHPPPVPCPCIVRATASSGDDFAVAPIVITGHPVGELVGLPEGPLVEVEVDAAEANKGVWASVRSALGGPTRYEATVSVRNTTTGTLNRLALSGSVGHWTDDDAVELDLEPPKALAPGETWTQEVVAEVSAPSVGGYAFEVVASGAGSTVTGTGQVSHHPVLLYLVVVLLVADVTAMVWRWIAKRRRAADDEDAAGEPYDEDDDDVIDLLDLAPMPSEPAPV